MEQFENAKEMRRSPDLLNNLGVALRLSGKEAEGRSYFEEAHEMFPMYLDAQLNFEDSKSQRVTVHPLRMQASRDDY